MHTALGEGFHILQRIRVLHIYIACGIPMNQDPMFDMVDINMSPKPTQFSMDSLHGSMFFFHGFTGRPEVEFGVFTLRDCQERCMNLDGCKGIEFSMNRCEIWMRDIRAVKYIDPSVGNFTCMAYGV